MAKTYKKQGGKLILNETLDIENEYTKGYITGYLALLNTKKQEENIRHAEVLSGIDAEITEFSELLTKANELGI